MFSIIIQEKGGDQRRMSFNQPEVTIGRVQGNDIVLPKGNVSKRHARIVLKDNKFIIVDLKSTNGTYVNGRKITSPLVVKESDKIYIGDFIVGVDETANGQDPVAEKPPALPPPQVEARRTQGMAIPPDLTEAPRPPLRPTPAAVPTPTAPPLPPPREALPPLSPPIPAIPGAPGAAPPPGGEARTRPPRPAPSSTQPPPSIPQPPLASVAPIVPVPPAAPALGAEFASGPISAPAPAPTPRPRAPAPDPAPLPVALPMALPVAMTTARPTPSGLRRLRPVSPAQRRGVVVEKLDSQVITLLDLQVGLLERLRPKLDLDKIPLDRLGDEDLWQRTERVIEDMVRSLDSGGELPKYIDQDVLIKETLNEALGLGPLEDLLADDRFEEIFIDRRDRIVVGKGGVLRASGRAFSSDDVLRRVLGRLVAQTGQRLDEDHPIVDVRLRDGSRLTAAIPPVAGHGAYLVLNRPRGQAPTLHHLVSTGALSAAMADFLAVAVNARRNVLVCGGAGAGKTALLGAIAQASAPGERIVSVEEVAELMLDRAEHIALETCVSEGGRSVVALPALVSTALRMRPDRLVVGEIKGDEAYTLVTALAASVDGASAAVSGEGGAMALARVAHLVRLAGAADDIASRQVVGGAFDVVVHVVHHATGFRVQAIEEATGGGDGTECQPLFVWQGSGFAATGVIPTFWGELQSQGLSGDVGLFR